MRYQTEPMTQIEEKWLRSLKVPILDIFWCLIMLIMQNWYSLDSSETAIRFQYQIWIMYRWDLKVSEKSEHEKSGLEVDDPLFLRLVT